MKAAERDGWWERCDCGGYGTWLLDRMVPVVPLGTRLWKKARADGSLVSYVLHRPGSKKVTAFFDTDYTWRAMNPGPFDDPGASPGGPRGEQAAEWFLWLIARSGRSRGGWAISGRYLRLPLSDVREAQTVVVMLIESWVGNLAAIGRGIAVLEGQPDPVATGEDPERWLMQWMATHVHPQARPE